MELAKPNIKLLVKRVGAEGARWAHNPKVGGSKPSPAKIIKILHKYKIQYHLFSYSNFFLHHKHEVGGSKPSSHLCDCSSVGERVKMKTVLKIKPG